MRRRTPRARSVAATVRRGPLSCSLCLSSWPAAARSSGRTSPASAGRGALAVDEESRRRLDAEHVGGARTAGRDVVKQLLVGQALVECFLREACLLGDLEQARHRIALAQRPTRSASGTTSRSAGTSCRRPRSAPASRRRPRDCRAGTRRMTKRILPLSMYLFLNSGKTFVVKAAQWPQVIDAYSTTVTLASVRAEHEIRERRRRLHQLVDRNLGGAPSAGRWRAK